MFPVNCTVVQLFMEIMYCFVDGCDNLLDECLLNSTCFVENLDILVVHSLKFILGDTCCVAGYLLNTIVHETYVLNG